MNEKIRPLTLSASIINIVLSVLVFIGCVVVLGVYDLAGYEWIVIVETMLCIVMFVCAVALCMDYKTPVNRFPMGVAITLFVLDVLMACGYLINLSTQIGGYIAISIILFLIVVAAAVLIMVDICRNYNLKNNIQATNNVVVKEQQPIKQEENKKSESKEDQLLEQIIKLQKMKESGMITAQEFNKLKTKLIDEF